MNIEKVKRYSLIEVVFLMILIVGLLLASLIVKTKAKVLLSDPIPLFGSGISVSMPANSGWEHTPAWQHEASEGSMMLVSQFRNPGRGWIEVHWRYIFSTPQGSEQDFLKQQISDAGAVLQDFDTVGREHPMTFARILSDSAGAREIAYLGIIRLEYNRSLELLVKSSGIDSYYEENIFKTLASSIKYETPQMLAEGRRLIGGFLKNYSQRLSSTDLPKDDVFLIKDAQAGVNIGYYTAIHSLYAGNEQKLQRCQIRQFEYKSFKLESSLWFNAAEKDYRWQTEVSYPGMKMPKVYEINTDKSGAFFVKSNVKAAKTFSAHQFFLPEPLLSELARRFLRSESDGAIVDVLGYEGQAVPVYLEKVSPKKALFSGTNSVIRIVYLHTQGSFEELFFDKSQNLLGKYEQQPRQRGRIWGAVSIEELQQIFQIDLQPSEKTAACDQQRYSENKLITLK